MVVGMTALQSCPFGPRFDFTDPDVLLKGIPVTDSPSSEEPRRSGGTSRANRYSTTAATG